MSSILSTILNSRGRNLDFLDSTDEYKHINLVGTAEGIKVIKRVVKNKKSIVIYGDYDCDGATASVLTYNMLSEIFPTTNIYVVINERKNGNGINQEFIAKLDTMDNIGLVYTVDHGTSNDEYIKVIRDKGIEVVVTDHHTLRNGVAPIHASAFINPQQVGDEIYNALSGCAVSYVFLCRLMLEMNMDTSNTYSSKDTNMILVAISTIGDMMDMSIGLNRWLCTVGIKALNLSNVGEAFGTIFKKNLITSKDISFRIVPMINSCSRIGNSKQAYDMLSIIMNESSSIKDISGAIKILNASNKQRKDKQVDIMTEAYKQLDVKSPINLILLDNNASGINGIVSSQVGNITNKPSITFIHGLEKSTGSCRAVWEEFNVKECFDYIYSENPDVFVVDAGMPLYGGHAGAGGCSIYTKYIDTFKELFISYTNMIHELIKKKNTRKTKDEILGDAISLNNVSDLRSEVIALSRLEPYGNKWDMPKVYIKPEMTKDLRSFVINQTMKIVSFKFRYRDELVSVTKFALIDEEIDIRDATLIGTIELVNGAYTFTLDKAVHI